MFKITDDVSYTCPVTVHVPKDNGYSKGTFNAQFALIGQDEIDQVLENARQGRDNGDLAAKVLVGWGPELLGADGQPFDYNDANKAALLNKPYFRNAVIRAFVESISGDGARRKN
jgi:hypothetical protein